MQNRVIHLDTLPANPYHHPMLSTPELAALLQQIAPKPHPRLKLLLWAGIGIGLLGLGGGLSAGWALDIYQAVLVNTLLFSGLAFGSIACSAIFTLTEARWARPLKRLAESTVLFIPISWVLFGFLMGGMEQLFAWSDPAQVITAKRWWLNLPFFIGRNSVSLVVTGLIGIAYVRSSVRPDLVLIGKSAPQLLVQYRLWPISNDKPTNHRKAGAMHMKLAVAYLICYTLSACQLGFDWIMSLDQTWFSSAFGLQIAISNLFAAGAFLVILAAWVRLKFGLEHYLSLNRHHDLSRLVFTFSLIWVFLIYCQVLVIWYANLPAETGYLLLRIENRFWRGLAYLLGLSLFLIPFFGLLSARACRSLRFSSLVAGIALVGLWWEKVFYVVPSHQFFLGASTPSVNTNPTVCYLAITLGTAAAFLLAVVNFLERLPLVPVADPLLTKADSGTQSTPISKLFSSL